MAEEDEVYELVRSVIMSQKGGVLLQDFKRDYETLAGQPIPLAKLGYKHIESLLDNIPEVSKSVNQDGQILYTSTGKNCDHLVELISKQKSSKNTTQNYKSKSNHFKYEERFPKRVKYPQKHGQKIIGYKTCHLKTDGDATYSGQEESEIEECRNEHHLPHCDTKHEGQKNVRGKMGYVFNGSPRFEEIYAISQRHSRSPRTSATHYSGNKLNFKDTIPPTHEFRQAFRNDEVNEIHRQNKFRETHSQYTYSASSEKSYFNMKQPSFLYDSHRCDKEFLRYRKGKNCPVYHLLDLKEPIYEEDEYYRGSQGNAVNSTEINSRHKEPQTSKSRNTSDVYECDSYDRKHIHKQRSYAKHIYGNVGKHSWEDGGDREHHQYMKDNCLNCTNRKINFVGGSLKVTIKNF